MVVVSILVAKVERSDEWESANKGSRHKVVVCKCVPPSHHSSSVCTKGGGGGKGGLTKARRLTIGHVYLEAEWSQPSP